MLSSKHCKSRAEALRFSLLVTSHRAAAARLRNAIEKYRLLAERARQMEPPPVDEAQAAIRHLAQLVLSAGHSKSKFVYKPLRIEAQRQRQLNVSPAKQALPWPPTSDLEKHLQHTILYYKQQIPPSHSRRELVH